MNETSFNWREEAKNKYNWVLAKSLDIAKSVSKNEDDNSTQIVANCLKKDNKLFKYFGAEQKDVKALSFKEKDYGEEVTYNEWCLHLWGRRIYSFLSIFTRGLLCAKECESLLEHKVDNKTLSVLSKKCRILEDAFKPKPRIFSPMQSLEERRDIANFHVTYLDPKLFSALMFWQKLKKHDQEVTNNKKERKLILEIIRREVSRYTKKGTKKIESLADESTLWWGIRTLIEETRDEFKIGNYERYEGALQICLNLIESNTYGTPKYPDKNVVMTEATWEIHGEFRTRLLAAMNCVEILQCLPEKLQKKASPRFLSFIEEQILYAIKSPEKRFQHMYFLGVFLEAIKPYLLMGATARKKRESAGLGYDDIVDLFYRIGVEMERHESTYKDRNEQQLRDSFITALSPNFPSVTGETINKKGKTDILIRSNGQNLFIAECKIWYGAKTFREAFEQLTNKYLTSRDREAAIIIFVLKKNMDTILKQIKDSVYKHEYIKGKLEETARGLFKASFRLPHSSIDQTRIAILCFHFPG